MERASWPSAAATARAAAPRPSPPAGPRPQWHCRTFFLVEGVWSLDVTPNFSIHKHPLVGPRVSLPLPPLPPASSNSPLCSLLQQRRSPTAQPPSARRRFFLSEALTLPPQWRASQLHRRRRRHAARPLTATIRSPCLGCGPRCQRPRARHPRPAVLAASAPVRATHVQRTKGHAHVGVRTHLQHRCCTGRAASNRVLSGIWLARCRPSCRGERCGRLWGARGCRGGVPHCYPLPLPPPASCVAGQRALQHRPHPSERGE